MLPKWLHLLSIGSLVIAFLCSAVILIDEIDNPQHMRVMNVVWPVVALSGSVLAIAFYYRYGRLASRARVKRAKMEGGKPPHIRETPFPAMVAKGALHCGSGCTLGDMLAEGTAVAFPGIAVWLGYETLFREKIFAVWLLDYLFAFLIGVAFQYLTIKPMRHLSVRQGIVQAVKADTLSLTAWQVGMYGFMALAQFYLFGHLLGAKLEPTTPEFWFMMQIAMLFGFVTSYPVNWWLIRTGVKERM